MRRVRPVLAVLALALVAGLAACGGDDPQQSSAPPEPATAKPADFPSATGKTLKELVRGLQQGPVLAPSTSQLQVGANRFGFALFDTARKQVEASAVAIYTSNRNGTGLRGPFPARRESMEVKGPFRSAQARSDLENGDTIYVATVPFSHTGSRVLTALARMDGRLVATSSQELRIGDGKGGPPNVGQKAISMHTLTAADVGGDLSKIDTRVPPARDLLQDDLAKVLGKQPVVLIFATPQLCASRVCGPVVDIAEQVRAESGGGVAFIHQEIYNDNNVSKGTRPQVNEYRLPTEPWTFVIDRSGIIRARFEGAFSAGELARAVAKVKAQ